MLTDNLHNFAALLIQYDHEADGSRLSIMVPVDEYMYQRTVSKQLELTFSNEKRPI